MKKKLLAAAAALAIGAIWLYDLDNVKTAPWLIGCACVSFLCFLLIRPFPVALGCALTAVFASWFFDPLLVPALAAPAAASMGGYCAAVREPKKPFRRDPWCCVMLALQAAAAVYEAYVIFGYYGGARFEKTAFEREYIYIAALTAAAAALLTAFLLSERPAPSKGKKVQADHTPQRLAFWAGALTVFFVLTLLLCLKQSRMLRPLVYPMLLCMLLPAAAPEPVTDALLQKKAGALERRA